MSDEEIEADEMCNALGAIANEIQKFHEKSSTTSECNTAKTFNKLIDYKFALKVKRLKIKQLESSLKTACAVAKTISLAKASEIASLSKHLDNARNKYLELEKQQSEKRQLISSISTENHILRDQLDFFKDTIQLGYQQLQVLRNKRIENVSTHEQLKDIIVSCGQYHADQYNEYVKCIRLQQKNSFLNTKMIIMENNLEAARDELRNLRNCIKPYKQKREALTKSRKSIDVVCSEFNFNSHQRNFTKLTMTKIELTNLTRCSSLANVKEIDFTTHIKKVKNLLNDHDNLVKDLKSLSRVINLNKNYKDLIS